jgi:hypothetical protein
MIFALIRLLWKQSTFLNAALPQLWMEVDIPMNLKDSEDGDLYMLIFWTLSIVLAFSKGPNRV